MQQWMCATVVRADNPLHVVLSNNVSAVVSTTTCTKPVPVASCASGERLAVYVIISARTGDTRKHVDCRCQQQKRHANLLVLEVRRMDISHPSISRDCPDNSRKGR